MKVEKNNGNFKYPLHTLEKEEIRSKLKKLMSKHPPISEKDSSKQHERGSVFGRWVSGFFKK